MESLYPSMTNKSLPKLLSDNVSCDVSPDIEKENMTWNRVGARCAKEEVLLNDFYFPQTTAGVNRYIYSASAVRNMLNMQESQKTSNADVDIVASFLSTPVKSKDETPHHEESTLQKFVRYFQPYVVVTSKIGNGHASAMGFNGGTVVSGLFAGSNHSESTFHPASIVQTELRMPASNFDTMPMRYGKAAGIFAVFDSCYTASINYSEQDIYNLHKVRYVLAPTREERLVYLHERKENNILDSSEEGTHLYVHEIAIRRIASIRSYSDTCIRKSDSFTIAVPNYQVDFSPSWFYRRYIASSRAER